MGICRGYLLFAFENSCSYIQGHSILRPLIFHQIFLSPQVKRNVIISNKRDIYELLRELPT